MQLRTEVKTLEAKNKDLEIEYDLLNKDHKKTLERFDTKTFDYSATLKNLENLNRELESTKSMLHLIESQHEEYVTRLRTENKKLIKKQEIELRIKEMEFEDIRSLFSQNIYKFNKMKLQSERDRVERRVLERKLEKMTDEKNSFKTQFLDTFEKLNETEERLNDLQSRYESHFNFYFLQLLTFLTYRFYALEQRLAEVLRLNERANMEKEEHRSVLFNHNQKFIELKKLEKQLKEHEQDVRAIKKRKNPYEYVDFADKKTQTNMMLKEKGCNTDELVLTYTDEKPTKKARSKVRSSIADTVTTALGGIPIQTDVITDYEMYSPNEFKETYFSRGKLSNQFKARPQSSNILATTYSYNLKNGVIEEEDPLLVNAFSSRSKHAHFQTVTSFKNDNFNSPSAFRPTALQKHQKAYKSQYNRKIREEDHTNLSDKHTTAIKDLKDDKNAEVMKSVYIHYGSNYQNRPMTEQPGMRKGSKRSFLRKAEVSRPTTNQESKTRLTTNPESKSRPASQDPTLSKTQTQGSMHSKNFISRCKSSLRNLIKVASTRNHD